MRETSLPGYAIYNHACVILGAGSVGAAESPSALAALAHPLAKNKRTRRTVGGR